MKKIFMTVLSLMVVTSVASAQWDRDDRGRSDRDDRREDRRDDRRRRDDRGRGNDRVTCYIVTPNHKTDLVGEGRDCRQAFNIALNKCLYVADNARNRDRCRNAGNPGSKYDLNCYEGRSRPIRCR